MSDEQNNQSEFLWNVHSYVNEYVRFADTKAAVLIGTCSALIAAGYASEAHRLENGFWRCVAWLALSFLAAAIVVSFGVIFPKLWSQRPKVDANRSGLIFWEDVLSFDRMDYSEAVSTATPLDLRKNVSTHVWNLCEIAFWKYRLLGPAMYAAFVGGALMGVTLLFGTPMKAKSESNEKGQKVSCSICNEFLLTCSEVDASRNGILNCERHRTTPYLAFTCDGMTKGDDLTSEINEGGRGELWRSLVLDAE